MDKCSSCGNTKDLEYSSNLNTGFESNEEYEFRCPLCGQYTIVQTIIDE